MGGPGVQRSSKFVHYLSQFGYDPVVFTIKKEDIVLSGAQTDETLLEFIPPEIKIIRTPFCQPLKLIRFLNRIKIYRFFWFFLYPFFWERMAMWPFKVFKQAVETVKSEKIKIVYTSSGPFSSLILGYLLKRKLGTIWVADLRDPYTDAYAWSFPSKLHWLISRAFEKKLLQKADHIIVNTNEVKKLYKERKINHPDSISVICNGY
jgi:glycosyltransferase involved in cell wall biosynthesis